ncbi:MAG TPA: OmpA family protein, partial [Bacteroidales bacterium]|nr:OmpA family protein [Bacteroidales bacterium]
NIGSPVNTRNWESQPSLSADGRTLYFVSNRPGGYGKKDIWVSTLTDTNTWTPPVNLGPTINTKEEEESPYIHADGKTLFFSSDGHFGMGKKDMFVTQKLANGSWRQPINMGYPLNTHNKESHVVVNAAGTKGYFASNQFGTLGGVDIFEFDIDETFPIKPSPVTYIKGVVYDAKNIDKKVPALIQLSDIETGEVFYEHVADFYTGSFIVPFYQDKSYALTVTHHGYLLYSEQVNLKTIGKSISIPMQPIAIGNTVVLNNVFFDTDSYSLKPESKVELLAIVDFMNQNPLICFEIGGHTDNVGNKQYNTTLSNNRAKAVYDFIVEAGISSSRLSYKGYADNKPVVDNTTPENRAKNRRTELVITKF